MVVVSRLYPNLTRLTPKGNSIDLSVGGSTFWTFSLKFFSFY